MKIQRKPWKKRLLSSITALAFITGLSALAGCHGKEGLSPFEIPEEFDLSRQYEITFWAKNDTNKTQTAIYELAISDFESLYPNITVNLRLYTDYGKIYNDVITNMATDTTPNVCIKTGSGFTKENGVLTAHNDVAFVTLPDGGHYTLAILVKDFHGSESEASAIMARISAIVYNTIFI